jgi:RNA-directed DNA polymerase
VLLELLIRLNRMVRGWTAYFKHGCSKATFGYLRSYLWKQVIRWEERKHRRASWKHLRRRYGIWPSSGAVELFDPARIAISRYPSVESWAPVQRLAHGAQPSQVAGPALPAR